MILYKCVFLRYVCGSIVISKGNISNLPKSIHKERIIFERFEKDAKLPKGPAIPNPGPTFPRQVATAEKVLSKSNPSRDTMISPRKKIEI